MTVDQDKLMAFVGGMLTDLGAAAVAGGVVIGHRLGLYRALTAGPATPEELARGPRRHPLRHRMALRAGRERLRPLRRGAGTFSLTAEQAFALTDPDGPLYLPGAFVLALGALRAEPRITEAFRTGAGMGWHEHDQDVFVGCELLFRPGYVASLVSAWLPALDGVEEKLRAGGRVADVGCGLGASTMLIAQAFPQSTVTGSDYHDGSIQLARKRAADAGSPTGPPSRWPPPSPSPAPVSTWSPPSTACTTWAIRSAWPARPRLAGRRRHLDGRRAPRR